MKTISTISLILWISICQAQNNFTLTRVLQIDSMPKEEIFLLAQQWVAENYGDAKSVIQLSDKESGTLIWSGYLTYEIKGIKYVCYSGKLYHKIKVGTKDSKLKVDLLNLRHESESILCKMDDITTDYECPKKGGTQNIMNHVWWDIKIRTEKDFDLICNSLNKYISEKKSDTDW